MKLQTWGICRPGGRSENQDALGHVQQGERGLWVVADGMGGHPGGEQASQLLVQSLVAAYQANPGLTPDLAQGWLEACWQAFQARVRQEPPLAKMHSTLAALALERGRLLTLHLGDCRIYWLRQGRFFWRSLDHSLPQKLVTAGQIRPGDIRHHPQRSKVLKAISPLKLDHAEIRLHPERLVPGDLLLLCSDGFWDWVSGLEMEIELCKANGLEDFVQRVELRLLQKAEGAFDNYSLLAIQVGG